MEFLEKKETSLYCLDPEIEAALNRFYQGLIRIFRIKAYIGPWSQIIKELKRTLAIEVEQVLEEKRIPTFGELKPKSSLSFKEREERVTELVRMVQAAVPRAAIPFSQEIIQEEFLLGREYGQGIWISKRTVIDPTVRLLPPVVIGKGCYIGKKAVLGCVCLIRTAVKSQKPEKRFSVTAGEFPLILKAVIVQGSSLTR